jgi:hypothetical protein
MAKPDAILIDGRAYSWRQLCELRRQQMEAWRKAQGAQPTLFALKHDCRPACERAANDRYAQPTFLERMHDDPPQN